MSRKDKIFDGEVVMDMLVSKQEHELSNPEHGERPLVDKFELDCCRHALKPLLHGYKGHVTIKLWNGEVIAGTEPSRCAIVFNSPNPVRNMVIHRDLLGLAEAHLDGDVDIEGDVEKLFDLVDHLQNYAPSWSDIARTACRGLLIPRRQSNVNHTTPRVGRKARRNSRASVSHHYDVGNDFYSLWLDPEMIYSCAYFRDTEQSLAEAQKDKLDYICRKLRLVPGHTLLDIGCGWGGLATWAARNYGVLAHGITLSERQYAYAMERVRREGLENRVRFELLDYRDIPVGATYDRVVSVGMFEHIGVANFPAYFAAVRRALKPGGLFLNHAINNDTGWRDTPITRFLNRYVFPDGELTCISVALAAMEQAGFEIIDVEGLRRHYTLTLRRWVRALEKRKDEAVKLVGEPTYRVWRLYMAGSAYYFDQGTTGVYQALASHAKQPLDIPLRRDDIYLNMM